MSKLFQPLEVADCQLQHQMVMAPMTRFRADDDYVPMDIMTDYYAQRASVPGTLIITEGVQISHRCIGMRNVPGIWSPAQVAAWRKITDAVHDRGSYIWCQLWVQGRCSVPALRQELGLKLLSSSPVATSPDHAVPEEMTEEEIQEVLDDYRTAAKSALEAGFDGIQLHGGNGYLPDQFLQDVCNKRTDRWGGSIENRSRFHIEAAKVIADVVGPHRTGVRLCPWSDFGGMGMEDPVPTFTYLVQQLRAMNIGVLDLVEARIRGSEDADCGSGKDVSPFVHAWGKEAPVMIGGGFTPETARKAVDETYKDYNVAVLFGRPWTSNPDLPYRVREGIPLIKYDRPTFYVPKSSKGYIDWEFSKEFLATQQK